MYHMKKYAILICSCIISISLQAQSIEEIKEQNSAEVKELKKEYFQNLQENQDARIFSIANDRETYTYKKLKVKRQQADLNFKRTNAERELLNLKKQDVYGTKLTRYNDSIANAIGFRRISKAIAEREKKRKAEELEAANRQKAFYRSQALSQKKSDCEKDLKSKLNTRHEKLKNKYAIED